MTHNRPSHRPTHRPGSLPWRLLATAIVLAGALAVTGGPAAADDPTVWSPAPGTVPDGGTYFYAERTSAGATDVVSFSPADANIEVSEDASYVTASALGEELWYVRIPRPSSEAPLVPGVYDMGATSSASTQFSLVAGSQSCNDSFGRFAIDTADVVDGALARLELRFEVRCTPSSSDVTVGAVSWDAASPAPPAPNPVAVPGDLWSPTDAPTTGSYIHLAGPARSAPTGYGQGYQSDAYGPAFRAVTDGDQDLLPQTVVTIWGGNRTTELKPGLYQDVGDDDGNPVRGALSVHQASRSCQHPTGWFAIDDVAYHGDELDRITFRFSQTCEGSAEPLQGKVSWAGTPSILSHTQSGPRRGGWTLGVLGSHLSEATSITVDGDAIPFTVEPPVLRAVAPEVALGTHEVVVTTPTGSVSFEFSALPNPATAALDLTPVVGKNSVTLGWTVPDDVGDAPATSIQVVVRPASGSGGLGGSSEIGADLTSASFQRLQPGSTYEATVTYVTGLGLGEVAKATFTVPAIEHAPFVEETALVDQQYRDFAGRAPTVAERNGAVDAIRKGTTTPDQFVASMRNRAEWGVVRAPVTRLYSAYFDRLPDASGLTYWSGKLRSGMSLAKVSATFAASSEFGNRYGKLSNGAFVDLVYRNVLHRAADPSGRTYWIRKLNSGTARGTVMTSFSESSEHIRTSAPTVDTVLLYTAMLRRMPTRAELPGAPSTAARTTAAAYASSTGPEALADQLRHTPAYAQRF